MTHPIDKSTAATLVKAIQQCRAEIDNAEIISRSIENKEFRETMKKLLGRSSLDLYSKVMGEILKIYPDLDPYK